MNDKSLLDRIRRAKSERRLWKLILNSWSQYKRDLPGVLRYSLLGPQDKRWNLANLERGISDHSSVSSVSNEQIERIAKSYRLMMKAQSSANQVYLPSRHWQEIIEREFGELTRSIHEMDHQSIKLFLSNFLRKNLGIEGEPTMDLNSYFEKVRYLRLLKKIHECWELISEEPDMERLSVPLVGNPKGYYFNNTFVTSGSFLNDFWTCELRHLLSDIDHPVICEIGGGYGKMARYLIRGLKKWTYIDFDIPEMVVIIFYFLSSTFPGKNSFLYGEGEFDPNNLERFDFYLLPSFEIEKLKDNSCDLMINKNSFGEMNKQTVQAYIAHVNRCCKNFFFHMNHERFPDTKSDDPGLVPNAYPIQGDKFKRIYRILDIGHYMALGEYSDIFVHLYERRP